ncbi:hypothetical protein [Blastopirellula marina]|uniref:Porin n=1 Tax=Blastopirellula marina TaxID=124 RepID=A0A2S8FWU8_9BACT|nr:hypothetical protein [Blastopirellula marina]PQO36656.1 hypothetical protein C5Y98_11725 [Blastopirellula marina]PTL44486.1 hypothetical protein C5Y97_11735 [Blastopirellula marina]
MTDHSFRSSLVVATLLGTIFITSEASLYGQYVLPDVAAQPMVSSDITSEIETLYRRISDLERKIAETQPEPIPPGEIELLPCVETEPPPCPFSKCVGYDNGFYARTCDMNYMLKIRGLIQFRHYADWRNATSGDDFESGFVVERAPIIFSGNFISPQLKYWYILQASRATGTEFLEEGKLIYAFENGLQFQAGRFRDPAFLREMDISYARQLAVERSYYNSVFATGVLEGISLSKQNDWYRWIAYLNDGRNSGSSARSKDFFQDNADIAISASTDIKFFGEWAQYGDFTSWPDEERAMFLKLAMFYENPEHGDTDPMNDQAGLISYATELTYESHGFAAFGSFVGRHSLVEGQDINQFGGLCQVSYQVIPDHWEPFMRYEYIWFDGFTDVGAGINPVNDSNLNIVAAGFNWYFHRQGFKFTIEAMHAFNEIPFSSPNTGFLADEAGESGQTVLRSQIQLFF